MKVHFSCNSIHFGRLSKEVASTGKRVGAHQCRRSMATTQLAIGRSPPDMQRRMGQTTLTMTNHSASLTVQYVQKSHEKYSPLRAEKGGSEEVFGEGYWHEQRENVWWRVVSVIPLFLLVS
jgi:hypothetical protein